jgi:hypothetical protein
MLRTGDVVNLHLLAAAGVVRRTDGAWFLPADRY